MREKDAVNFEGIFSQLGQGNISGLSMFCYSWRNFMSAHYNIWQINSKRFIRATSS